MYEFVITSTTNSPVIVVAATPMKAIHKVYADHNIVQDNIYAIIRGREQDEHTGDLSTSIK